MAQGIYTSEPEHPAVHISKKRRRCDSEDLDSELSDDNQQGVRQLLAEEFDLEISLRERLATTIESRITWALLLQESLSKDLPDIPARESIFQDVALEAMDAIDEPLSFLFEREIPLATLEAWAHSITSKVPPTPQPQHPSRPLKPRGAIRTVRGNTKLLFVRDVSVNPTVVAKMVCPDCDRFDFNNLQGLLNHCRLRHKRDFGSHDECMQRCAVIVPEDDREWVLTQGTELSIVSLPSLRRLFEIAVGAERGSIVSELPTLPELQQVLPVQRNESLSSTHLSRTLGHHVDTPALAPFLGRAPKRRCINVYDVEGIDILSMDDALSNSGLRTWHMSYSHRNNARQELDAEIGLPREQPSKTDPSIAEPEAEVTPTQPALPPPSPPKKLPPKKSPSSQKLLLPQPPSIDLTNTEVKHPPLPDPNSGSRFHITARVIISDHSLWIRPDRIRPNEQSHRWMLAVSSPSYSLHITAFLTQMTVTCLSNPPPPSLANPITVKEPPFAVTGTSSNAFLARVTLVLVGKQNLPMDTEHWVEMDPFKATSSVLGEEQVLDVELDRHTELLPVRSHIKLPVLQAGKKDARVPSTPPPEMPDTGYTDILKSLLPRVPMTTKDAKGRTANRVPYKLVATPTHFSALVPGRRKAIEWARARALCDLYTEQTKATPSEGVVPLTIGDVYCWLEDEGHFIRPAIGTKATKKNIRVKKSSPTVQVNQTEICSQCGIKCRLHPSFPMKPELSSQPFVCDIIQDHATQPPRLNLRGVFGNTLDLALRPPSRPSSTPPSETHIPSAQPKYLARYSTRDMLSVAPPSLITAVHDIADMTGIHENRSCLETMTRKSTEDHLAPYAILSTALKSFVSVLINRGLDTARWDLSRALMEGRRKTKSCVLTPSHIIRGIRGGLVMTDAAQAATALCLTQLAIPSTFGRDMSCEDEGEASGGGVDELVDHEHVQVKTESDY